MRSGRLWRHIWRWIRAGCFETIVEDLRSLLRELAGGKAQPAAMILDRHRHRLSLV
jgi:hypothetical protein